MNHDEMLVEIRKDHEYLRKEVDEIKNDVREMRDAVLKYRAFFGGALFVASCVGAFITFIVQHFLK